MNEATMYLYNLEIDRLCDLFNNNGTSPTGIKVTKKINEIPELSFNVSFLNPYVDFIVYGVLVEYENQVYEVISTTKEHGDNNAITFSVTCQHYCNTLRNKQVLEADVDPALAVDALSAVLYENSSPKYGWSIGTITVQNIYRGYNLKEQSVFETLVQIAQLFNAHLEFSSIISSGSLINSINMYDIDNYGSFDVVRIDVNKNLKNVNISYDATELVTRLYCFGGTDPLTELDVDLLDATVNEQPYGLTYVENYSYFTDQGYDISYILAHPNVFLKEGVWRDSNYVDPDTLYTDAVKKIGILSKPKVNIKFTAIDVGTDYYGLANAKIGYPVIVTDEDIGVSIQCIVTGFTREYDSPWIYDFEISNIVEYGNVIGKLFKTSNQMTYTLNNNGTIKPEVIEVVTQPIKNELQIISGDVANIQTIFTNKLVANYIDADDITANMIDTSGLVADTAFINDLTASTAFINALNASTAFINTLSANDAFIQNLIADTAFTTTLSTDTAFINALVANDAYVQTLAADSVFTTNLTANTAFIDAIVAEVGTFSEIDAGIITSGYLNAARIEAGTITSSHIATGTIEAQDMKAGTITAASGILADAVITTAKIADAAITNAKIDRASVNKLVVVTADIQDANITTAKIGDLQVTTGKIALLAVDTAQIKDAAIATAKIGDLQVTTGKIALLAVDTAQIKDAAIQTAKIGDLQVTTGKIALLAVDSAQIKDAAISTAKIGDLQVTNAKINDINAAKINAGYIDAARINANTITASMINSTTMNATLANAVASSINTAFITDALVSSLSASKITTGTLNATNVTITNLRADSITVGTINGTQITDGAISLAKLATDAATAITTAQTTANGKNTVFYATSAPSVTGRINNDVWFDTDDGYKMYKFLTGAWVAVQFGTSAIANLAITDALIANATISSAKISAIDAGKITTGSLDAARIAAGTITSSHIAANTIVAGDIQAGTITATEIAGSTITGAKLNLSDVITTINNGSNQISSNRIQLSAEAATLEVAFNSLKSTVTTQGSTLTTQGTSISTIQGQISTKVWQTDIDLASSNYLIDYYTIDNLIDNSSFSDGTVSWSSSFSTFSVSNNVATLLADSLNDTLHNSFTPPISGHKYYVSCNLKTDSSSVRAYFYEGTGGTWIPIGIYSDNAWHRISYVGTILATNGTPIYLQDSRSSGWTNIQTSYWISIDLTATYGAGLEPTKEEMDYALSFFPNSHFEDIHYGLFDKFNMSDALELSLKVSTAETAIEQNTQQIALKASQSSLDTTNNTVTAIESNLTVASDKISLIVSGTGGNYSINGNSLISAINVADGTISLQANRINLQGAVTLASLGSDLSYAFGTENSVTKIDGSKIITGSVTANIVNLKGLTVRNDSNIPTLVISQTGSIQMQGTVKSENFVSGSTGWQISESGNSEFNNSTVRGSLLLTTAGATNIDYDANNKVRFYAGSTFETRNVAPFRVLENGTVYATTGNFGGTFTGSLILGDIEITDTNGGTDGYAQIKFNHDTTTPVLISSTENHFTAPFYIGTAADRRFIVEGSTTIMKTNSVKISQIESGTGAKDVFFPNSASDKSIKFSDNSYNLDVSSNEFHFNANAVPASGYNFKFKNETSGFVKMLVDGSMDINDFIGYGNLKIQKKTVSGNSGIDFSFT